MTKDTRELMERIEVIDTDRLADVLTENVYGNPEDVFSGFEGYEAARHLKSLVGDCKTAMEFDMIDRTVMAIIGWSLNTLIADAESKEE